MHDKQPGDSCALTTDRWLLKLKELIAYEADD
jgi:hypothetical protein